MIKGWHWPLLFDHIKGNADDRIINILRGVHLQQGANTPVIIKYPFWQMTLENEKATYASVNYGEAFCPAEIEDRSICVNGDIGEVLARMEGGLNGF